MTLLGHALTKYILGIKQDASGAFRSYKLKTITKDWYQQIQNRGYGFFIESMYIFSHTELKIKEVPIEKIIVKEVKGNERVVEKVVYQTKIKEVEKIVEVPTI